MKPSRIFISHSSDNKMFAEQLVAALLGPDMDPWIDSEQISTGDDLLDQIGRGLHSMDILILLISQGSLTSDSVALEVKHAIWREVREKQSIVLPFIIDDTPIDSVLSDPRLWFLGHRHLTRITQDVAGVATIVIKVRQALERRSSRSIDGPSQRVTFMIDPVIEKLIKNVDLGDWNAAKNAAVNIIESTDDLGNNVIYEHLLNSLYYITDDDLKWGAIQTIESVANLASWLIDHAMLARLANHSDFTIRTVAANICLDFAHFAPDRVPLDIVFRLAKYDEDWYVMTPATAALKAMVRPIPGVLNFFYTRLNDSIPEVREWAAAALMDISNNEPEVLEPIDLERELSSLVQKGDKWSAKYIAQALSNAKQVEHRSGYKYGI